MNIKELKPGMRVMRRGTVVDFNESIAAIVFDGVSYNMHFDQDQLDGFTVCGEERSVETVALKKEILLELANLWDERGSFSDLLRRRAEEL